MIRVIEKLLVVVLTPLIFSGSALPSMAEQITSNETWDVCLNYESGYSLGEQEIVFDMSPSKPGGIHSLNWICANNAHQRIMMLTSRFNQNDKPAGFITYDVTQFGGRLEAHLGRTNKRTMPLPNSFWMDDFSNIFSDGSASPSELRTFSRTLIYRLWEPVSNRQ